MDVHKNSKAAAAKFLAAIDVLSFSPYIFAQAVTNAPGPIQRRVWLTIRALIHLWTIDAKARADEPENQDMYRWAERHYDGNT